jgi:molecular chaperone GrpE (heat shock protein)
MDANFLEFWGNLLISMARGQKQLDDMMRWVHQGFPGANELTTLVKKAYGLNDLPQGPTSQAELSKETLDKFYQSYREYLNLLDVIPRTEYQKLQEENDALKERIGELEQIIADLHALLAAKVQGTPREAMETFQTNFLKYLERLQEAMISVAAVSKGPAVKETDYPIRAENGKR